MAHEMKHVFWLNLFKPAIIKHLNMFGMKTLAFALLPYVIWQSTIVLVTI